MTQTEMIATMKRLAHERDELGSRVASLVNGMYVQGQAGCALAFELGQRIAWLEAECERWAALHIEEHGGPVKPPNGNAYDGHPDF